MIQLTVNTSLDKNKIGETIFNKNLIYIGNDHLCDLYIKEDQILANHLIIEIVESKMIIHPHKDIEFFLVNGKRSTGHKFVVPGDKVKVGETEFTITNFIETVYTPAKEQLNKLTDELINEESPLLDIIQEIQSLEI